MIIEFSTYRSTLHRWLWQWLEALPLALFLAYVQVFHPAASEEWRTPYYVSASAAIGITVLLLTRRKVINRIYLGLAWYFVSGSIGLLFRYTWLNEFYGQMEATAMLIWIVGVGLFSTMASPKGFLGIDTADRGIVRRRSLQLLTIAIVVTLFSWRFRGNDLLAAYVPFITLLVGYGLLRAKSAPS